MLEIGTEQRARCSLPGSLLNRGVRFAAPRCHDGHQAVISLATCRARAGPSAGGDHGKELVRPELISAATFVGSSCSGRNLMASTSPFQNGIPINPNGPKHALNELFESGQAFRT